MQDSEVMEKKIKFGTDGWRAVIADDFTFDNLQRLSQAVADYIKSDLKPDNQAKVAVGFDSRFLSPQFAKLVADVLSANSIDVILSDKSLPTPALSFAVKNRGLDLGIMITASHNPHEFNGFKIKTASGGAAPEELTKAVEERIDYNPVVKVSPQAERIKKENLTNEYVRFLRSYIDLKKLKKSNFKVLIDVMYGSGNSFYAEVLKDSKMKLEFLHNEWNPSFGGRRPEPIEANLKEFLKILKTRRFDLGLVLDGDADRIAAGLPGGEYLAPQKILGLLILHLIEDKKLKGGVVKTIAGTSMIDLMAQKLKFKLYETPVGFKYISSLMETEDIVLGGEEAGGIGFKNYIPERDGTLAGLLLLEMMAYRNKGMLRILKDMETEFGRFYYVREDLPIEGLKFDVKKVVAPAKLLDKKIVQVKDFDGVKFIAEDLSWLMLRGSGTEPLVRIYSESRNLTKSNRLIEVGKEIIKRYADS